MSFSLGSEGGVFGWLMSVCLLVALVWHSRRSEARGMLLVLRSLAVLALVGALVQPSLVYSSRRRVLPRVLALLDNGHPMSSKEAGRSRLQSACDWLQRHRREIDGRADMGFYALSDRGQRLGGWESLSSLTVSDSGFQPSAALREVMDDLGDAPPRPERAWLFSDGNAEPDPELEKTLAELKIPMDVVAVGPSRRRKGVAFTDLKTPDFAFLHGRVSVEAAVEVSGLAGRSLELVLSKQSRETGSWDAVDRRRITPRTDFETIVASLTATAQSLGSERYRLGCSSAERSMAREFRVEVIRQKYRIMYLCGRPSAEYANLREFLKSDPNHELVSFVILRNPESQVLVADQELSLIPFPAEEIFVRTISQFDLFILENFSAARFRLPPAYLSALKSFVASGGALLVIGGENSFSWGGYRGSPLEELLPVTLSDRAPDFLPGLFRVQPMLPSHPLVQLYDTLEQSRAAWEALPQLDGYGQFASVKPGATVLATHPQARMSSGEPVPVFAIRDYGRGKVMLVSSDSTWRWRLGAALDWKISSFYGRFWTKAVQYLTGNLELSKVKFAPLPDRLPAREPALISLRIFDEGFRPASAAQTALTVLWTAPGGTVREIAPRETGPGTYALELTGLTPGPHRLKVVARYQGKPWGEDEVRFEWGQAPVEAPVDRAWLRRASESSGGTSSDLDGLAASALLEKLPPIRWESEVLGRRRPWASLWWLGLSLALFLIEWAARRWRGYP